MPARATRAPAKINLGLRIVGTRSDGYHLLESLFVPLALADDVSVEVLAADGGQEVTLELEAGSAPGSETVPTDGSNLAVRAAERFLEAAGLRARLRIGLRKRIPAAAGLGGGSSDAGAVLRLCAALFPDGSARVDLPGLALALGADVPFFLAPQPAIVRGIGERLEPFEGLPEACLVLANPGISLSTAEVYRLYDRQPDGLTAPDAGPTMPALSGLGGDPTRLSKLPTFTNDLEAPAIRLCPEVADLRDRLRGAGAAWAAMSGSGPTVYGVFASEAEAAAGLERARLGPGVWSCVTRFETRPTAPVSEGESQPKRVTGS